MSNWRYINYYINKKFNRATLLEFKKALAQNLGVELDEVFSFQYKEVDFSLSIIYMKTLSLEEVSLSINGYNLPQTYGEGKAKKYMKNSSTVVEVSKILWNSFNKKPIYASGLYSLDEEGPIAHKNQEYEIKHVNGINFFGPEFIRKYDKKRLLKAPFFKTEKVGEGILLLSQESPLIFEEGAELKILDYLKDDKKAKGLRPKREEKYAKELGQE